jgi:4-carboxymuconolactone decarboxylase
MKAAKLRKIYQGVPMFNVRVLLTCGFAALMGFGLVRQSFCQDATSRVSRETVMPSDIYPDSGSRLPPIKREGLDDQGKQQYDALVGRTGGRSLAGLRGPGGLNLYSPKAAQHLSGLSNYLRYESGLSGRVREVAILVTAREMDQQFEWTAHEPNALKEGVPPEVIEVIKGRKTTDNLSEADATIIQLGRQVFGEKKVASDVFARARKLFGDRGLVELVLLMGSYSSIAALLTTFDVQLAPGQKPLLPPR